MFHIPSQVLANANLLWVFVVSKDQITIKLGVYVVVSGVPEVLLGS